MPVDSYSELNEFHKDALQELGNIGTGNAITALSQLTQKDIEMHLPHIRIVNYRDLPALLGSKCPIYVGVVLLVEGDLECVITFMLNQNFAEIMLKNLLEEDSVDVVNMDELAQSAICEVGNVMCNSYLNALAVMADVKMDVSIPFMRVDTAEGVLDTFVRKYLDKTEELLFIENTFYYEEQEMISHILLHPKFAALQKILERIGAE